MEQKARHLHLVEDLPTPPAPRAISFRPAINERRFHDLEDGRVMCRVCFAHPVLVADHIDLCEGRATFHCPVCGGSSLIRWDDATALGVTPSTKAPRP